MVTDTPQDDSRVEDSSGYDEPSADSATNDPGVEAASSSAPQLPSLTPGVVLLGLAAVLIVVVLVKPDMPPWLRVSIAVVAVIVVVALLVISVRMLRGLSRNR